MKASGDPKGSMGRYISRLNVLKNMYLGEALKPYGLGSGQYIFLLTLFKEDGISQDTLTERLLVDKATTARALGKLEAEGYVERVVNETDRRKIRINLTVKGRHFEPTMKRILDEWIGGITKDLTPDEEEKLLDLLRRVERNAEGML
jgi:DNA-binding MarR family transcriptional regulator